MLADCPQRKMVEGQPVTSRRCLRTCLSLLLIGCVLGPASTATGSMLSPESSSTGRPGDWWQNGRNPRKSSFNRVESTIGRSNVSQLVQDWRDARFSYGYDAVAAGGLVYFAHLAGMAVFPLGCGTGGIECTPLWRTDEAAESPVVAGDLVFATTVFGVLGYPARGCGSPKCEPVMTLDMEGYWPTTLTAAGDALVATALSFEGYGPGMWVFDLSRCSVDPCPAIWKARIGDHELGSAAVARGSVYVGTGQDLKVYDLAGCGAEFCEPKWIGHVGNVLHADTTPTVAGGHVYLLTSAVEPTPTLQVFPAGGCGNAVCEPVWGADVQVGVGAGASLALAYGKVWVEGFGQVDVFGARGCGMRRCEPLWIAETSRDYLRPPSVANGVMYTVASDFLGPNSEINAFSTECDAEVCQPLAVLPIQGQFANTSFVSQGKFVVSSFASDTGGGTVEVYGLP